MAQVTVRAGTSFRTEIHARDFVFLADEPSDQGGTDSGPMPSELLLGALTACAVITAQMYARRKGWPLEGVEIHADNEKFKAVDYPAYSGDAPFINQFHQRIEFKGDLTPDQKQRLLEIAGRCPIHRILTEPNFMIETLVEAEIAAEQPPML